MADYNSAYTGVQIDENIALAATATQPGDLATVATTGAYNDLTGKPTLGSSGGPAYSTDVVAVASGYEKRNQNWSAARRKWDVGYTRTQAQLDTLVAFFHAAKGKANGFRFKDHADFRSGPPSRLPQAGDQHQATGDGVTRSFALIKTYGSANPYVRRITKPVAGSLKVAVDGVPAATSLDATTGTFTFTSPPAQGAVITAGFEFDVPVRFDSDRLEISLAAFEAGQIPSIPIVEIRP